MLQKWLYLPLKWNNLLSFWKKSKQNFWLSLKIWVTCFPIYGTSFLQGVICRMMIEILCFCLILYKHFEVYCYKLVLFAWERWVELVFTTSVFQVPFMSLKLGSIQVSIFIHIGSGTNWKWLLPCYLLYILTNLFELICQKAWPIE